MSLNNLRQMVDFASNWAEEMFAKQGTIAPIWHAVRRDGSHFVLPPMINNKDAWAIGLRAVFEKYDVVRCLFTDEAWTAESVGEEANAALMKYLDEHDGSLAQYPGRIEVVVFQGEDAAGMNISAHRRIIREAGKPARLGPLVIDQDIRRSEGRFVGLLPPQGARQ